MAFLKGIRNSATARSPAVSSCYDRAKWQHVHSDSEAKKTRKRRHYLRGLAEKVLWFAFPARGFNVFKFPKFSRPGEFFTDCHRLQCKKFCDPFSPGFVFSEGPCQTINNKMMAINRGKDCNSSHRQPLITHH